MFLFSNRVGCLGSILLSIVGTLLLLVLTGVIRLFQGRFRSPVFRHRLSAGEPRTQAAHVPNVRSVSDTNGGQRCPSPRSPRASRTS